MKSAMPHRILSSLLVISTAFLNGCMSAPTIGGISTDFTSRKDVVFTSEKWPAPLAADTYKPSSQKPTPAVLLIHGGGWNDKERRSDMARIAKALAKRGYFVMNTTYRLTPDWKFPAQAEDMEEALRYMRRNSTELNIAPERIATFGYSAGGHLAALAGLNPKNKVKTIVAGGAPSDLSFWPNGKLTGLLLGGPLDGKEKIYREASPVTYVKKDSPPIFIYHGTKDTLVPVEHPKAFISALEEHGVDHEVYWIEGRSHILSHLFSANAIPEAIDFLDKNL
ncbi:MAG: alpha/beta hydrolase [Verrucomicrobia bacterium]|nr:alpha/beta hydrolase [Verrucomicrobiota bacterium]